ncbi:MAG: oligosaccharide flippase family protein [Clostridia bacterium]|nr:oligosaccharide flippase family protein [Clostridia bacterium]
MRKSIFINVGFLAVSNILVRILGMVYKVWLAKEISPVALGIYQLAMSVYGVFIVPVATGLPNATNRLCAKYASKNQEKGVLAGAISIGIIPAVISSLILFLGKDFIANTFLHSPSASKVVLALIPAVSFGALASIYAGYLHAKGKSICPAAFEIIEQIGKIAFAIILVRLFVKTEDASQAALPALAVGFGGIVSFCLMSLACGKIDFKQAAHKRELLENAYPPTLARLGTSLLHLCTTTILPICLVHYGLSEETALSQYGILTSMAYPVVFVPMTVISAMCVVILPEIARNLKSVKIIKKKFVLSLLVSFGITAVFSVLLILFGPYFAKEVFNQPLAGKFMVMLVPSVIFLGLSHMCRTTLNGIGKQKTLMVTSIIDGAFGVILTFLLARKFGIYGFVMGNCIQDALAFLINFSLCISYFRKEKKITKAL